MTVVFGLVRRTWLVALVAVIACAGFAARAVAALVEASYLAPVGHGTPPLPRGHTEPVAKPQPDGAGFVARNMFCSTCSPAAPGPGSTDFVPAAVLIATSLGEDPRATIRVPASEVQGSFGIGDAIPGVGTIATIGWVTVDVVDASGRHGVLSLVAAAAGAATPAVASEDPWAERVHRIDDHTYEVDRSLVRELVSGAARPGGTRVLPVTSADGKLAGLRIAGAGVGSLAAALGLRNADVISEINGAHIESANTLLDLYSKLDQLNVVELDGTRGGKPLALTLHLR